MCMKYLDANLMCYKSISRYDNKILSLNAPFNSISIVNENNNKKLIKDFSIFLQMNFLGTNNDSLKLSNPLVQKEKIDVLIRLTKCSKEPEERLGTDIDYFQIDLSSIDTEIACFEYCNYSKVIDVDSIELPFGAGKYVIKILVKKEQEEKYTIQSMSTLIIKD